MEQGTRSGICLGCDRRLESGDVFCLHCGGLPFARSPQGAYALSVGPVASMDFRRQAASYVAGLLPEHDEEKLRLAFAHKTIIAEGVDALVGQAFIDRLKRIPAEAAMQPIPAAAVVLSKRLLSPVAIGFYAAAVLGAFISPWLLPVGVAAGVLSAWRPKHLHLRSSLPLLPPPPASVKALPALLPLLKDQDRQDFASVARGSFRLLAAAASQGMDVQSGQSEGMGRSVSEVLQQAIDLSKQASDDDDKARKGMQKLVSEVEAAVDKLSHKALPQAKGQALLEAAEIVNELADI